MKTLAKLGLAVVIMSILANLLFGGADKDADIPALIKDGALVVDTRTAGEYAGGHIDGAINIPYNAIAEKIGAHANGNSRQIIVYCHSGARSGAAKRSLISAGYTDVVNGGSLHRMRKHIAE